jgi:hypothetical protein
MGMQQPEDNIVSCLHLMVKYNVKYYITFNLINRPEKTRIEEQAFQADCKIGDCEFWSIPIPDYTPPTINQLHDIWSILDRYHVYRTNDNKVNLVMHCTGGTGRTATMLMSYVWYKMYISKEYKKMTHDLYKLLGSLRENGYDDETLFSTALRDPLIQYLKQQLAIYDMEADHEVFENSVGNWNLFISRLFVIMEACFSFDGFANPSVYRKGFEQSVYFRREAQTPAQRKRIVETYILQPKSSLKSKKRSLSSVSRPATRSFSPLVTHRPVTRSVTRKKLAVSKRPVTRSVTRKKLSTLSHKSKKSKKIDAF